MDDSSVFAFVILGIVIGALAVYRLVEKSKEDFDDRKN